jgi:pimeloyl-ACP methyl ester carboxylesterase
MAKMMIKKLSILLISVFLLAACNGNDEGSDAVEEATAVSAIEQQDSSSDETETVAETAVTEQPADPTAVQPTLTPPPPPTVEPAISEPTEESSIVDTAEEPDAVQPRSETVMIEASDGLQIEATYEHPGGVAPFPGVILIHMLGSNRTAWDDIGLTAQLLQNGYAVLNVDMRGHGGTGGAVDWSLAEDDFQRVWDYFVSQEGVDGEKTAVIGASIGSNLSLITAVNRPSIATVILLSPGLDYRGVTTEDAIIEYGDRPILIVASEEDSYAADSSRTLHEAATGEAELQLYNGAGHGTSMFNKEAGLPDLILNWLQQYLS